MIKEILEKRILVLDGAMGTMLQAYNFQEEDFRTDALANHDMPLKGNNDMLSLSQPQAIKAVHRAFLEAGADIIETNTFSGTSIAQADYGLEHLVYEINKQSAIIAKEVADEITAQNPDKPRLVAGALGPTNKTASISPDVNRPDFRGVDFDTLRLAYREQAQALIDGGVDILLVETVFDTLNAKAALFAIQELKEELNLSIPVMLSGTITDASGRTLTGQTPEAFYISLAHFDLLSVGLNCALGAKQMVPSLDRLASIAEIAVSAYPNAGLPNAMGEYDETPHLMAENVKTFLDRGLVNILGGCCGTTPDHIAQLAKLAATARPRQFKSQAVGV